MQLAKSYESTSRKRRAAQKRQDAVECERAGYMEIARINWEMAAFLDPPRYDDEPNN